MNARPALLLFGASNVARSLPVAIDEFARRVASPFDVFAAQGNGRSFGMRSRYLARELPSILDCGLWNALDSRDLRGSHAIVTDVGNDLAYGVPPERIAGWVETCLLRLEARGAAVTLVGLARERLEKITPLGSRLLHAVFFARHPRIEHADAMERVRELDERLDGLARGRTYARPPLEWYGLDPIHIRRVRHRAAWSTILDRALADGARPAVHAHWAHGAHGAGPRPAHSPRGARPLDQRVFGREKHRAQPSITWPDGSTFSSF